MPLTEFPGVKTPPKYEGAFLRFMNPLLDAMREKGGQARPREIYDAVAQNLNLSVEEPLSRTRMATQDLKTRSHGHAHTWSKPATLTLRLAACGGLPTKAKKPTLTGQIST